MVEHEDWHDMPLNADVKRFIEATRQAHLDDRQSMIRYAAVLCTCTRWYNWRDPEPPQVSCMVHTTIMFDGDGGWM